MTYITPQQLVSIIGHIDLVSPLLKIPTYLIHVDPKSTPIHGNSILLPSTFVVRVDGNFHPFPWFGSYLWSWRIFVQDTPLNIPYMDNPRSKLTANLTRRPRLIHRLGLKVKATSIYGRTCALEG